MNNADYVELFVKGAVVGLLVGDALGYPYEDVPNLIQYDIDMARGRHGESIGAWAMPGAFTLATITNIIESDGIDLDDLMDKFNDVYIAGYLTPDEECKDVGFATSEAIRNFSNGLPLDRCGLRENANDNDCLLRTLPVGLFYAPSAIDELVDRAHVVCRLTHATPLCEATCAAYCLLIRNILLQKAEKALELLDDYYRVKTLNEHRAALQTIREYKTTHNPTGSKAVIDSFWSAWMCHARNENDYAGCVTDAVRLGNDTNGTAALAGSLSALTNGLNDIPAKWLKVLKLNSEAMEITQAFVNSVVGRILQAG